MAKYLHLTCPKCKDYPGLVVPEPPEPATGIPINAYCLRCGFKLLWSDLPYARFASLVRDLSVSDELKINEFKS